MIANYLSSILTLAVIITLLGLHKRQSKYRSIKGKDSAYAGIWWISIFVFGFILYFTANIQSGKPSEQSVLSYILFSVAESIKASISMFKFDLESDIIFDIASAGQPYGYIYCAAIIACYISASLWTVIMAKNIFLKGISNEFNIFFHAHKGWHRKFFPKAPVQRHYIIIGCCIARVFLENLVKTVSSKNITVITGEEPDINVRDKYKELVAQGYTVIFGKADEIALKRAGIFNKYCKTIVVAMSEKDEENLFVANYVTDYIRKRVQPQKTEKGRIAQLKPQQVETLQSIDISVYAMYNYLERSEHFSFMEYALGKVRFFNPYDVRARKFLMDFPITSLIPPVWINTGKGRLKTADEREYGKKEPFKISNVFVGFGLTNRQLLKKSICNNQLLGIDYRAYIIDKDIDDKEKQFRNEAAGLFDYVDENGTLRGAELIPDSDRYFESPLEKNNITFNNIDALSVDFYKAVIKEAEQNDFTQIIIALGDDKVSIETALELRQKLYEADLLKLNYAGNIYDRVKIFVKVKETNIICRDNILNDKFGINCPITVFGAQAEIFTDTYIIEERLDDIAKCIANEYWVTATKHGADVPVTNIFTKWDALTQFKRDSNRYAAMAIRVKLNLLGFDISEGDSISPAVAEKYGAIYGIALANKQRKQRESGRFVDFLERDGGGITDTARNNLARLEHQRWNAFHLVNGWTKLEKAKVGANTRQDEKAKQHACITTLEGLTELREKQANALIDEYAKTHGDTLPRDKALSDADIICYDFDVMDKLIDILNSNKHNGRQYIIIERN